MDGLLPGAGPGRELPGHLLRRLPSPPGQARRRLDGMLPPPVGPQRPGYPAAGLQRDQLSPARWGSPGPAEPGGGADPVPRVRPRGARAAQPLPLPEPVRHRHRPGLLGAAQPDHGELGHGAGGAGHVRPPPPDRRASAGRPGGPDPGLPGLQPGVRHHRMPGRGLPGPGLAHPHRLASRWTPRPSNGPRMARIGLLPQVPVRHRTPYFAHSMGGETRRATTATCGPRSWTRTPSRPSRSGGTRSTRPRPGPSGPTSWKRGAARIPWSCTGSSGGGIPAWCRSCASAASISAAPGASLDPLDQRIRTSSARTPRCTKWTRPSTSRPPRSGGTPAGRRPGYSRRSPRAARPPGPSSSRPRNITGNLHMGHALVFTLHDILTRFKRARGFDALWVPGVDHAGIATQIVVERQLKETEGKTRQQVGREAFMQRLWDWKDQNQGAIENQLRRLGASVDWTRKRFTLDPDLNRAVRKVFVTDYKKGKIYKGPRMIQWDPASQTALSDLEVNHVERQGKLWYSATPSWRAKASWWSPPPAPRPCWGTPAVAVHPGDERYRPPAWAGCCACPSPTG